MQTTESVWAGRLKTWWPALALVVLDRVTCWIGFILPLNVVIAAEALLLYIGYGLFIGFRAATPRAAAPFVGIAVLVRLWGTAFQAGAIWHPEAGDAAFLYGFAWGLPVIVAALLALGIPAARGRPHQGPATDDNAAT